MLFETYGDRKNPAVLFFHAMGVTGASSSPVAERLQDQYFCILPTSTVYCPGQRYRSKADEVRQVEDFLRAQGVERLALVVASSIGADLALAFVTRTKLEVGHVFFDGGQFARIGRARRAEQTPFSLPLSTEKKMPSSCVRLHAIPKQKSRITAHTNSMPLLHTAAEASCFKPSTKILICM